MNKEDLFDLAVKLENQRCAAMVTGNINDLRKCFSEDLFYGHADGFSDRFESFIQRLVSGSVKYNPVISLVHEVVSLGQDAFTLNGEIKVEAAIHSVPVFLHCLYVGVWRLENAHWRFVAHQSAKLPAST
ncbi:nuclear transport factor 2 family protein [Mucilaginibacter robiniae]|uniref:Nuclear transport factor 2 family protein n=1 Tax=Mucilaginibacter robiniae TaxID=2728022 RepID=A0A7L5DYN5_9SPHI|nr:nuclear transport factor 2 family protein [Mucilaginibacter robiniae]QJD96242.1 nuclear transport factor 2 family protein [Mucilaginibacter robiniae]